MYKIGIIGQTPDVFSAFEKERVTETMNVLSFQYGDDLVYNIPIDIGVGLWSAKHCYDTGKKSHVFLAYPPSVISEHWYDEQTEDLNIVYLNARAITVIKNVDNNNFGLYENTANEMVVDDSNFVIVFWDGRKQGSVFDTIRYAFDMHKMVIDGFSMKLLTVDDTNR